MFSVQLDHRSQPRVTFNQYRALKGVHATNVSAWFHLSGGRPLFLDVRSHPFKSCTNRKDLLSMNSEPHKKLIAPCRRKVCGTVACSTLFFSSRRRCQKFKQVCEPNNTPQHLPLDHVEFTQKNGVQVGTTFACGPFGYTPIRAGSRRVIIPPRRANSSRDVAKIMRSLAHRTFVNPEFCPNRTTLFVNFNFHFRSACSNTALRRSGIRACVGRTQRWMANFSEPPSPGWCLCSAADNVIWHDLRYFVQWKNGSNAPCSILQNALR